MRVSAQYPGADAAVISESVAEVLKTGHRDRQFRKSMMSSSSSNGSYSLSIQFDSMRSDMAAVQVQNAMARAEAQLPSIVRQLGLSIQKSNSDMALVTIQPERDVFPTFLKNYFSLNYMDELKSIPGSATSTSSARIMRCGFG